MNHQFYKKCIHRVKVILTLSMILVPASSAMAQWATSGSDVYYNSGNVGIGTSSPISIFQVVGGDAVINGVTVGKGNGSVSDATAVGQGALQSNAANSNTAVGYGALSTNVDGYNNTAVGTRALNASTGNH